MLRRALRVWLETYRAARKRGLSRRVAGKMARIALGFWWDARKGRGR